MFNARYASISLIGLVAVGIVVGVFITKLPPSPHRLARDSHSGRASGHRAVFELLQAFDVPVSRHQDAAHTLFQGNRRVLLLDPDFYRLEREHETLDRMAEWVKAGGELLVVSPVLRFVLDPDAPVANEDTLKKILGQNRFLESLDLTDLTTTHDTEHPTRMGPLGAFRRENLVPDAPETPVPMRASGTLEHLGAHIETLHLAESYDAYFSGEAVARADGRIEIPPVAEENGNDEDSAEPEDEWQPIALDFFAGDGRVTFVACAIVFGNRGIGHGDNAVFAYHLATGGSEREVVIDEFYHGCLQEGNWLALLGMSPYGMIFLVILAAVLCHVWASVIRFGPPVPQPSHTRRTIMEYVDAMARMFLRGRKGAFVLATCQTGFLDSLREELCLAPNTPTEGVIQRLHRTAPDRADLLAKTCAAIDAALSTKQYLAPHKVLHFQEELERCRIPMISPTQQKENRQAPSPQRQAST